MMEELKRITEEWEKVFSKMNTKRQNIFTRLYNLDKDAGKREMKRKEVMLREMKLVLAQLGETEKTLVTELKAEAMDKVGLVNKLSEKIGKLSDEITLLAKNNDIGRISRLNEDLESLKTQLAAVDLDFLEKSLDIQLNDNSTAVEYEAVRSQYRNLIFYSAGNLSPRNFLAGLDKVTLVGTGGREDRIQFSIFHVDRAALSQEFILKQLMVIVSGKGPDGSTLVHEKVSVFEKIRRQEGQLLPESASQSAVGQVLVTVRLHESPVEISLKLFDCNIVGSPCTPGNPGFHLPKESVGPVSSDQSLALFDATSRDLGSHDLTGLDDTDRRIQPQLNASQK